jgi:hypothetical protein
MLVIGGSIAVLALGGVLAWTRFAPAQAPATSTTPAPGEVLTITAPQGVEVRSGPSASYYPTSKLRPGDKVKVAAKSDKNNAGWIAIEPPAGSQSWINAVFVERTKGNVNQGIVKCDEDRPTPIKPRSALTDQEPNVESFKVSRGTQVVILGAPLYAANEAWLPIQPPLGDVRFIPESAVATVQPTSANASGFVPPPGGDQSPLAQADAALASTKQLYEKAAQSSDPTARSIALNRLAYLQQMPMAQGASMQPGNPSAAASPKVALTGAVTPTPAGNTAMYASNGATGAADWSKWGFLRKTAYKQDGQPLYRLEDERGSPLGYAMAAPSLTLEPYVGQFMTMYGPTAYWSNDSSLRSNYMVVSRVSLR